MLEAIADFWKPVKRLQGQTRLKPDELQVGSTIGFGFVPQPNLSGRRLTVTAINTYKFGADILTSFVLTQENDVGVSMIVAESNGEQYCAISRRISISDRNRIFNHDDIEAIIHDEAFATLHTRDVIADYRSWLAPLYRRQSRGVKGQLYKGDHRGGIMTGEKALDFTYAHAVSETGDQVLEIELYGDGRIEVYATVYRRLSDIGEVTHPQGRSEVKLVSNMDILPTPPVKPEPKFGEQPASANVEAKALPVVEEAGAATVAAIAPAPLPQMEQPQEREQPAPQEEEKTIPHDVQEHAVTAPIALPEFSAADVAPTHSPEFDDVVKTSAAAPAIIIHPTAQPFIKQEIKAVNKDASQFVNESIDCELQVANTIINEAIRNEMRINDVVRRVIGLPVSQQESVQIPIILTDQDYALLAIRYGLAASDREEIKRRITDDLSDFSGANKQKKAA